MWNSNGGGGYNPLLRHGQPGAGAGQVNWQQQAQQWAQLQQHQQQFRGLSQQPWLQQQQQYQQWPPQPPSNRPPMFGQPSGQPTPPLTQPPVPYGQPPRPQPPPGQPPGPRPPSSQPPPGQPSYAQTPVSYGQPPLPATKPPVPYGQPTRPGGPSGQPPPPPPPDQPPPPPGSDGQPPVSVSKSTSSSTNSNPISKLNLSAPPPPPPPEQDTKNNSNKNQNQNRTKVSNSRGRGFNNSRGQSRRGGGYRNRRDRGFNNSYYEDNTEYDDNNCDEYDDGNNYQDYDNGQYDESYGDMDLENDHEDHSDQGGNSFNNYQSSNSDNISSIRPGDWRCKFCQEINFSRREKCRKCGRDKNFVPEQKERESSNNESKVEQDKKDKDTLKNFDAMFSNWEETYKNWKKENENNPDHLYVENYKQQMEAMRLQLLEKRKKLQLSAVMLENWHSESGTVKIDNGYESVKEEVCNLPSNEEQIKKILDANDYDEDSEEEEKPAAEPSKIKRSRWGNDERDEIQEKNVKKSRWNNEDEEDNLDIDMMRRRPEPFNNQQSFQPRPSLLDHPRPNFNQNEAMFNERNFGGPPRGFGGPQRGFGGPTRGFNGPQRGFGGPARGFGFRGGPRPTFNNFQNHPRHQQPPDFENFWKPTEVKDYSQNPRSFSQDREFKPQTFDYSHGNKNREPREPMTVSKPATLSGKCVMIDSILSAEGRASRPVKVVIILRGVPGCGKSHLAKLIKDKEVEAGGDQPRTMSLDDYFTVDGEYEYEEDMEEAYRASLLKSFKKNIDAGLFSFLILDAVHNKTCQFKDFWSYAKQHGYEVKP